MCGIVGFYKHKCEKSDFDFAQKSINYLMSETDKRGKDTSGVQIKNAMAGKKYLFKRNFEGSRLVKDSQYLKMMQEAVMSDGGYISMLGHCRMQTNGTHGLEFNNQPTIKDDTVCVHNGIITNIEMMWEEERQFTQEYEIDTEIICDFFNQQKNESISYGTLLSDVFEKIYGETTIGIMPSTYNDLIFATNTGSSFYLYDEQSCTIIVSSESFILKKYKNKFKHYFDGIEIKQLNPGNAIVIDEQNGHVQIVKIDKGVSMSNLAKQTFQMKINSKLLSKKNIDVHTSLLDEESELLKYDEHGLRSVKRCTKCLLPESFPFIAYDDEGVCNYCHNYKKIEVEPAHKLEKIIDDVNKREDGKFLLTYSGGRDSCYGMHLLKQMGAEFLSYTYDWGMVTDLARRNQSRMCGKLGVEHIIVSADIDKKRLNIKRNVEAWLKRPSLGLVPLFMAGDKQFFYYANKVGKDNGINDLVILCDNPYEVTYFKFGFAGAKPNFIKNKQLFRLNLMSYFKMLSYYFKEFLLNPRLLNGSFIDTVKGFLSYYAIPHNYINLFKYIKWDEKEVERVLLGQYNWELAPDAETSWRIGDGTAPFYNYIYTTVAGFSENDTFRSNQIREGVITREEGLELVIRDNAPRYGSIKWYLDAIGIDFKDTIERINGIKKLY